MAFETFIRFKLIVNMHNSCAFTPYSTKVYCWWLVTGRRRTCEGLTSSQVANDSSGYPLYKRALAAYTSAPIYMELRGCGALRAELTICPWDDG